jgi:hypothetical protein
VKKIRHALGLMLAVGALLTLNAAPVAAEDYDHHRHHGHYGHDDTGRPCGSLFDILEGDAGECGVLNLLDDEDDHHH